ncbi:nucleotidyltransferase, partial [Candidatus Bipolaricaulota bacterium]|nr:nucleotidyltransferase [Candidatus Bipolaricaulota bacterium]
SSYQRLCDHLQKAQDQGEICDYSMVGYVLENTLSEHGYVTRGICTVDQEGYLVEIHERARIERFGKGARYTGDGEDWVEIPEGSLVSMNMWGFTPSLFSEVEARFPLFLAHHGKDLKAEFLLPELIGELAEEKKARVKVLPTDERWFGVTYQEDKPKVKEAIQRLIKEGTYPANLWNASSTNASHAP